MMKKALFLSLAFLSGCVAANYHPTGATPYSSVAANQSCAHSFDAINRTYALGANFGLVGVAVAGLQTNRQDLNQAQAEYDSCMAGYGWLKN